MDALVAKAPIKSADTGAEPTGFVVEVNYFEDPDADYDWKRNRSEICAAVTNAVDAYTQKNQLPSFQVNCNPLNHPVAEAH